jgi:ferredoxin
VKIRVRSDLCCGAQLCTQIAPQLFRLDALGYNASDGDGVPEGQEELAERAAGACPESAIRLEKTM